MQAFCWGARSSLSEWWPKRKKALGSSPGLADIGAVSSGLILRADRQIAGLDDRLSDRS